MITISRNLARNFLTVLRRSVWNAGGSRIAPPVLFQADHQGLTLSSQSLVVALSLTEPGHYAAEYLALTGEAFKEIASPGDQPISLDGSQPGEVAVSGGDGGSKCYPTLDPASLPPFPASPDLVQTQEQPFLACLCDAMDTAWDGNGLRRCQKIT